MKPTDVSTECWNDWVAHRRMKKAIVSDRVVKMIRSQAEEAGWTLEQAMDYMMLMGWQGFRADWVEQKRGLWNHLTGNEDAELR